MLIDRTRRSSDQQLLFTSTLQSRNILGCLFQALTLPFLLCLAAAGVVVVLLVDGRILLHDRILQLLLLLLKLHLVEDLGQLGLLLLLLVELIDDAFAGGSRSVTTASWLLLLLLLAS